MHKNLIALLKTMNIFLLVNIALIWIFKKIASGITQEFKAEPQSCAFKLFIKFLLNVQGTGGTK